jgi:hypothetical protein
VTIPRPVLAAVLVATALIVSVAFARRAGVLDRSVARGAQLRRGRARASAEVHPADAEPGFTSRPVPRSVAALTTPEQADSPMVHDG